MGFLSSLGGFLGGAGNVLGGVLGAISAHNANSNNAAMAQQQLAYQQSYAKSRLQWQVEDAKKAGLHPMVAAGLSPVSFSPVSANQQPLDFSWVGDLGQTLDYAATKAKTNKQQAEAYNFQKESNALQLDSLRLDNELKQMEIMSMLSRLTQTGPAAPDLNGGRNLIRGQNDSPFYSPDSPYGKDLFTLFTLARHGDTLYEVPHPDIADSITETEWKNILSSIDAELQAETGVIKPPVYKLTPEEQRLVREHKAELVRIPGVGWKLDRNPSRPHPLSRLSKYEKFNRRNTQRWHGKQQVSGPILD